jgi:hypothetical protein
MTASQSDQDEVASSCERARGCKGRGLRSSWGASSYSEMGGDVRATRDTSGRWVHCCHWVTQLPEVSL